MQFSAADITGMLAAMGEPCVLTCRATRITVTAVYGQAYNPGSPIDGIPGQDEYSVTAAAADVVGVDTTWQVTVRDKTRPVLAVLPDGSGFVKLLLGDPQ